MNHAEMQSQKQGYFQALLEDLKAHNNNSGNKQGSFSSINKQSKQWIQQAAQDIVFGLIQFKRSPDCVETIIVGRKKEQDIEQIDSKIKRNEQMLRKAKRQLQIYKRQQQQALKLQNQAKARQNQQKIKIWSEQQKIFNLNKRQYQEKRQKEIEQEEGKIKKYIEIKKQQQLEERKMSVQQRLRMLWGNKFKRNQLFQLSEQQSKRIKLPRFKEIQKEYQKMRSQENFQKEIAKKNLKLSTQLNHDLIKQHQKNYLQKIYQRDKNRTQSMKPLNQQQKKTHESRYTNLFNRNEEEIQHQKQKFQRRLNYQERLSQMNINVDEEKRMKMQIAIDRAKNPLKYNFLRQKNLNDYQIYVQFKDFQLDIDRNQLGKQYLEQSKKIAYQSRLKRFHSVSAISLKNVQKQVKYKDYLQELKAHHSVYNTARNPPLIPSIQQAFKTQAHRSKTIQKISQSLKKFDTQIKDKRQQLKSFNTISSTLKKQRQIDQIYMKSLKAKLACLQMQ